MFCQFSLFYQDVLDTEVTVDGDYVEMEMDEFNQHECMASLIAVLRHMYRNNITPEVTRVGYKTYVQE